jgi:hypothetical protein
MSGIAPKQNTMPDLPLCLGVLKHRTPLTKGAIFLTIFFYDGFLLMWCIFKFEGVLFRSDSRHNDRVDHFDPFYHEIGKRHTNISPFSIKKINSIRNIKEKYSKLIEK